MTRENAYRLLELPTTVKDEESIKRAYKKLAMKHHPDKGGTEENFKKLQQAKDVLLRKEKVIATSANGRSYTQAQYDDLVREFIRKSHEELNEYEKQMNKGRKKMLIRAFICLGFIVYNALAATIGLGIKSTIISLISFFLLMYIAPTIALTHDAWLLYKEDKKLK